MEPPIIIEIVEPPTIMEPIQSKAIITRHKKLSTSERCCGAIFCCPCITWSLIIRGITCHVGGNMFTDICDIMCCYPIIYGETHYNK